MICEKQCRISFEDFPYQDLVGICLLHFVQCLEALPNTVQPSVQRDLWADEKEITAWFSSQVKEEKKDATKGTYQDLIIYTGYPQRQSTAPKGVFHSPVRPGGCCRLV